MRSTITRWTFAIALALALVVACGKKGDTPAPAAGSASAPPPAAGSAATPPPAAGSGSATAQAPATPPANANVDVPTSTEFESEAATKITDKNLSSQLDAIEKDVGQ